LTATTVEAIRTYRIPDEKEDYVVPLDSSLSDPSQSNDVTRSNLRLFPPPLFSRQGISQVYKFVLCSVAVRTREPLIVIFSSFKANPASIVSTVIDEETGDEKKRMINKMRWKGTGPASILFIDKSVDRQELAEVCIWLTCCFRFQNNHPHLRNKQDLTLIRTFSRSLRRYKFVARGCKHDAH
jgi:hypothetical protein